MVDSDKSNKTTVAETLDIRTIDNVPVGRVQVFSQIWINHLADMKSIVLAPVYEVKDGNTKIVGLTIRPLEEGD